MPESSSTSTATARRATPRPLQAAFFLAFAYLLSRVIGLLQLLIIRALLPPEAAAAYTAAFALPEAINYLVAGGAMSVTFIPIFTELGVKSDVRAQWRFFSTVATIMGIALTILVVLGIIFAEPLVRVMVPGFNDKPQTLAMAVAMTKILLPAQLFFYLGGMLVAVLNAHKRFGVSGFNGVVYNLVAILAGMICWLIDPKTGFAWGILLGALCGNFLLPLAATLAAPRAERLRYFVSFEWRSPAVRRFFRNALPIMLGVSLPVVDTLVLTFFASEFRESALANLLMGNRFMLAALAVVAQAASVAAFPFLAANSAAGDWKKFAEFLRTGLRRLIFLTLPLSLLLILTAQPLLALFRVGQFGGSDARQTGVAFAFFCVGLFAWAGQQLVARGFYALQDTRTPTVIGSILTVFFIGLCAWMKRWDVPGLAYATSIGVAAHFVAITIALNRKLTRRAYDAPLRLESIVGTLLRTGSACALMGIAGLLIQQLTRTLPAERWSDMLRIVLVGAVSSAVFTVAATKFAIPEWFWLRDKLRRRRV